MMAALPPLVRLAVLQLQSAKPSSKNDTKPSHSDQFEVESCLSPEKTVQFDIMTLLG